MSEGIVTCLAIGDPHIKTKEIEYTDLMIAEIIQIAMDTRPDFIVVLGDTLHTHDTIRGNPLSRAVEFLRELRKISFLILLIGNHDLRNNQVFIAEGDTAEHPFTALHEWDNTIVCDVAKTFTFKGVTFCGVPYVPNGKYREAIKDVDSSVIRAFFSHQEFRGVKYTLDGDASEDGDLWSLDDPLNICGHIHEAQILGKRHPTDTLGNLIYVGTPIQQDHGANPDKGISIFTFPCNANDPEFSPYGFTYDRIQLKTTPLRVQYRIPASDIETLTRVYNELLEITTGTGSGRLQLTKIRLSGTTSELQAIGNTPLIKDLRRMKNTVVTSEPINVAPVTILKTHVSEEDRTFERLIEIMLENEEPEVRGLYHKLFPARKRVASTVSTDKKLSPPKRPMTATPTVSTNRIKVPVKSNSPTEVKLFPAASSSSSKSRDPVEDSPTPVSAPTSKVPIRRTIRIKRT